jgi:hypothetical protein
MARTDQSKFDRFGDHGVDGLVPTRRAAFGHVVTQPPDHIPRPHCLLADPLDDVAHALRIGVRSRQHAPQRARVVAHRRQRLVQFVGDRRCHLAHRGQARHMNEFGLQFHDAQLTAPLAGDIANDLRRADDHARRTQDRRDGQRHRDLAAILVHPHRLVMADPHTAGQALEDHRRLVHPVRWVQQRDRPSDHFRASIAEDSLGRVVPARDNAIQRLADDRVVG